MHGIFYKWPKVQHITFNKIARKWQNSQPGTFGSAWANCADSFLPAVWLCGMVSRRNRRGGQNLRDATAAVNRWTRANLDQTDLYSHVDTGIWSHLP